MRKQKNPYHAVPNHQPLDRVRDLHHRWWWRGDYRSPLERAFLGLGCMKDPHVDVLVHGIVHTFGYYDPRKPSPAVMEAFVERHQEWECGCRRPELLVPVNILYVARDVELAEQASMAPCAFTLWDKEVLSLANELYVPRRDHPVNRRQVRRIDARHALGVCGCYQDGRLVAKQQKVAELLTA